MKPISWSNPILSSPIHHHHRHCRRLQTIVFSRITAKSYGGTNDGGNVVDENMIVLRMRIQEAEMGGLPPVISENWMEWEKKYYEDYVRDVCEAMRMLQMCLMNTRPSLALGTLALLMLSVPLSASIVIYNFIRLFN
ncbi:uncharacterized protein LOC143546175 [Bidens hawaiensis]|uniref:uncharacterized protein LOC143546175 n=1 Tax=Bidens hawaiensis TaxID=980011 RepID=UPI00404AA8F8